VVNFLEGGSARFARGDRGRAFSEKDSFGKEMQVRDLFPQVLPSLEKGQWVKMTSPQEDLVAILRSEVRGSDIHGAHPEMVTFRPLRVFYPSSPMGRGRDEGKDYI